MKFKGLTIGNLKSKFPIIQGGMGVGISASSLAGAVARAGGIGIISTAQIGYKEKDFLKNTLEANLRALKQNIIDAKNAAKGGIVGINIMVAGNYYKEHVLAAIEAGVDLIISGAGLPMHLPEIVKGTDTKIAPIVSSTKGAKLMLKLWDTKHNVAPDLLVVEGPRAGGHLGFKAEDVENPENIDFDSVIREIVELKKPYEEKYSKSIPVVAAGGVFTGGDIAKYLKLGADGVQMATRFVATEECDADIKFKEAYINAKKEDIVIVKSPVGMPGRAILNPFMKKVATKNQPVETCFNCLKPCNPASTPYCISMALIRSAHGDTDNGLVFCGDNAYRLNKIVKVQDLMDELATELEQA